MKKLLKFFTIASMVTLVACDPAENEPVKEDPVTPEVPQVNENLEFTLEVASIEAEEAKIKVEHNGTTKDTWYGFVTTEQNIDEAISDEVESMLASGKVTGLKKNVKTTVTLRGLEPETDYTYIVFGLTSEGKVYGKKTAIDFTTAKGEVQYSINPAWDVEYTGAADINGTTYQHTVTVTSTDQNPYLITVVEKEHFDTNDIKTIALEEIAYLQEFLDFYNQTFETNITLGQMLYQGSGMEAFELTTGDWYALAIGVESNGEPTGHYAVSELITIAEQDMSEAYASWLGDWTFTGKNGVAFDVTFHKNVSNESFYMTGWEYIDDIPVEVTWMEEDGLWVIFSQLIGEANFGAMGNGDIWFIGNDGQYIYPVEDIPLCMGGNAEDGSLICIGYSEVDEETGEVFAFDHAQFIADISESYYTISDIEVWPQFPIVITPSESTATKSASVEAKSVKLYTNTPRVFKAFPSSFMAR